MRCRCCDSNHNVKKYKGDYYCEECREFFKHESELDFDDSLVYPEVELLHRGWDDET